MSNESEDKPTHRFMMSLNNLPLSNIDTLVMKAKWVAQNYRRRLPVVICLSVGQAACILLMILRTNWFFGFYGVLLIVGIVAYMCIVMAYEEAAWPPEARKAFNELAECNDVRIIGPLLDVYTKDEQKFGGILYNVLHHVQATDAHLLDARQRQILYRLLNGRNIPLMLAILHALEQIGDANALPFVEKLAAGQGRAKRHEALQQAAQNCLPFLQQKVTISRMSDQLLRAASPVTMPEVLLRPAIGNGSAETNQLLRPDLTPDQD